MTTKELLSINKKRVSPITEIRRINHIVLKLRNKLAIVGYAKVDFEMLSMEDKWMSIIVMLNRYGNKGL